MIMKNNYLIKTMETKLSFYLNNCKESIICNTDEYMKDIFKKYANKKETNISKLFFLYNGTIINEELKLEEIIKKKVNLGKKGKKYKVKEEIKILVYEYEDNDTNENTLKQSKYIICPICTEICLINFSDYKFNLNFCKNFHSFWNLLLDDFNDFQKIDESKILCNKCDNNKNKTNDYQFYKCFNCNINLCPLCKESHNSKHIIINYDKKDFYCNVHGERYI